MFLIIGGLLGAVFFMAHKTNQLSQPGSNTNLPPATNVPSSGATARFSPAMTGGTPMVSKANQLRLHTNYTNTLFKRRTSNVTVPRAGSAPGILGGQSNTNWDGGFFRVKPPPTSQPSAIKVPTGYVQRYKF